MSADLALELEDVVFRYQEKGRRNILDHTSLTIPAGTLTVLMGGSGCGKSTLAAVAAGLYPENGGFLESGIIRLYGQDLKTLDPQKRAAYLTVLFQNPDLQFCMNTLREEMRFCLENICIPAGKMDERIEQAAASLASRRCWISPFRPCPAAKTESGPLLPLCHGEPLHPAGRKLCKSGPRGGDPAAGDAAQNESLRPDHSGHRP